VQETEKIDTEGMLHRRCRIRAFCWSEYPGDVEHSSSDLKAQAQRHSKCHLLVVANDNEEIIVLRVRSPYDDPLSPSKWSATVLKVINTGTTSQADTTQPGLFSIHTGVHDVAMTSWTADDNGTLVQLGLLAYAHNKDLKVMSFKLANVDDELVFEADANNMMVEEGVDLVGPLRWAAKVGLTAHI